MKQIPYNPGKHYSYMPCGIPCRFIWLHTTLEDLWPHYMIMEVCWDGGLRDTFLWALTISWLWLLARVWSGPPRFSLHQVSIWTNPLNLHLVKGAITYDFTLHLRTHDRTTKLHGVGGVLGRRPLGHFLVGSHNFMVTALGSCVKWPSFFGSHCIRCPSGQINE
jgi:hypothetical protein